MALAEQRNLHSQAFQFISKALDLDPVAPSQAIVYYRKGLRIMNQALSLQFSDEEIEQAKVLEEKMNKNFLMVQNRLQQLEDSERSIGGVSYTQQSTTIPRKQKTVIDLTTSSPTVSTMPKPQTQVKSQTPPSSPVQTPTIPTITNVTKLPDNRTDVHTKAKKEAYQLLRGIDKSMQQLIMREIVDDSPGIAWEDVVGQDLAKQSLYEIVIWPSLRPDLFTGLRSPCKGLLLFGPPGNGKTLLAKAVATQCKGTFFSISASSLVSKYVGESEKLVRALFTIARLLQPSIVFIDEIDSMLGERGSDDTDASRRLKTEFLVQLDGVTGSSEERVLVLAATNRPWDLDEAFRRRLGKRIFIDLPSFEGRKVLIKNLLKKMHNSISNRELDQIVHQTDGFSGSDLTLLCKDAAMGPLRELGTRVTDIPLESIRPVNMKDFTNSLTEIRPSTSPENLQHLKEWNNTFGSVRI